MALNLVITIRSTCNEQFITNSGAMQYNAKDYHEQQSLLDAE